jgi:hypothetical protein
MLAIRQWGLMLVLACIAPLSLADLAMSAQQQCDEYGVYQDSRGNWIDCSENITQNNIDEAYIDEPYIDEGYIDEPYVEEPYVEDVYKEEPYVEQPYVEEVYVE